MSDGKNSTSIAYSYPGRGSKNTFSNHGRHRYSVYYCRCGMLRPTKTKHQNHWRAFLLGQLIRCEVYASSAERLEILTISKRLARKLGFAYSMLHITTGILLSLFFFATIHSLANPELSHNDSKQSVPGLPPAGMLSDFLFLKNSLPGGNDDSTTPVRSLQTNIHIGGQVTEQGTTGTTNPINAAKVQVVKVANADTITQAYTNNLGLYNMNFVWTENQPQTKLEDRLYPNPYTNTTNIELFASANENYSLRVFNAEGKLVLNESLKLKQGLNQIAINGGNTGVKIINISNGKDNHNYKAIQTESTNSPLNAQVVNEGIVNNPFYSNDAYSSTASNNSFKSGTSTLDDILKVGDQAQIIFKKAGYYTCDTIIMISENNTVNKQMEKILITYVHNINGTVLSSNPSKQIIDGTQIYIVKSEADTAWTTTTGGNFTYSFTDATSTTNIHVGANAVPGHNPNDIVVNVGENTPVGIMFNVLNYSLSQPILVNNQYAEGVSGAQIAGGDVPVFTDATGRATYTSSNLETDINNLPFSNYATDVTVSGSNIQTLNQIVNSNVGTNAEQTLITTELFDDFFYGTSTSPNGTLVRAWKDGVAVHTGTVNGTSYETNHVTRTTNTFTVDSLTFEKANYTRFTKFNVVLVDGGNKEEANLQPIQQYATLNFTLKLFTQDGHPITETKPNASNTIQWADATTNTYPVNVNGEINVSKLLPINNGSFGNATFTIDTTDYNGNGVLPWMIFRRVNQSSTVANIAQNQNVDLVPEYTVVVPLDSLANKTIHEYTLKKELEGQPGVFYRMDEMPATGLIRTSGDGKTSKFIKIPSTVAPYLDFVQKGWNETTNLPVPQADLDRSDAITQQIINISYLPNGDTLLPPHRMYTVASTADPKWQALVARGFDNSVRSAYYNNTPGNTREWIATHSYNGQPRIWRTTNKYNANDPNGALFEEKYSATYGIEEGTGNLIQYIYIAATNQPTELAKSMANVVQLLDIGTD